MEIKLILNGQWIMAMWKDGELLSKEDADHVLGWMLDWANTCQYPEDVGASNKPWKKGEPLGENEERIKK